MPYDVFSINGDPYLQMRPYNPTGAAVVERNTNYYIVNTNVSHIPDAWKEMIGDHKTGKAATYYDRKEAVCRIQKRSIVYLYHTGIGVIAKGESTSMFQEGNGERYGDEEYYIPLDFEWAYGKDEWNSKAPTALEINQRLGTGHKFRQTVFSIDKEMAGKIDEIAKEKQ